MRLAGAGMRLAMRDTAKIAQVWRKTDEVLSEDRVQATEKSVTAKIKPAFRSGRASSGRARSRPAACVVSMQTPTLSMMSQMRSPLRCSLMSMRLAFFATVLLPSRSGLDVHKEPLARSCVS
jgi:hypothetical protein